VVPFASPYERLWLGLGAVSFDLFLAVIVTSLLRRHLSRRVWRAIHLLAYASWPVAWFHSFFSSGDLRRGPLFLMALACAIAVIAATGWRVAAAGKDVPRAQRVGLLMNTVHRRGTPPGPREAGDSRVRRDEVPGRERTLSR
jgi:DMSO/TMAO reductase YedYZ heme-binding membrane subunit